MSAEAKDLKGDFEKVYVLDTNVILSDAQQVLTIGDNGKNLIVLPETVIDELDVKKTGLGEIHFQAREFGRILSDAAVVKTASKAIGDANATVMSLEVKNVRMDIISFSDYDLSGVDKSVVNDRKIIEVAKFSSTYYDPEVKLLSNDVMCRVRAISMGLESEGLMDPGAKTGADFIKIIDGVDSTMFSTMENKHISTMDPEHIPENYCYHFRSTDGNEQLAYVVNGQITKVDEEELRRNIIKPMNSGQLFAMSGMMDDRINIALINAIAGSGKTLLAIAAGMKLIRKGQYSKIVYIRNSVESVDKAEEVGFLPGMEEKFKIYNYPLYDTLEFIAQKELKGNKGQNQDSIDEHVEKLMKKYKIETMWNGAIRGRTISNAYVIIDEVQNFGKTSLQTVLTRLDKDSKVVCIGSNRQIDHPYVNKHTNGLSVLLNAASEDNEEVNMFGTELNKVVRGKITEFAERIFEKK